MKTIKMNVYTIDELKEINKTAFNNVIDHEKQNDKWTLVGEWVNYFGKWLTRDKFDEVAYGKGK